MALDNLPKVQTVINDGGLRIAGSVQAPKVTIIGATNNAEVDAAGAALVRVNDPIRIVRQSTIDLLGTDADGRPSEIKLGYEDAFDGGARNLEFVVMSKVTATLAEDATAAATAIKVRTQFTNTQVVVPQSAPPTPVDRAACVVVGGILWIFGGRLVDGSTASDVILKYDPSTDTWTTVAVTLATARFGHTATAIGTKVYIAGGTSTGTTPLLGAEIEEFDTASELIASKGLWAEGGTIPPEVFDHAAFSDGTDLFIVGGTKVATKAHFSGSSADVGAAIDSDNISDGTMTFTLDGTDYDITGIDLTVGAPNTENDIAVIVDAAINTAILASGLTVTFTWDGVDNYQIEVDQVGAHTMAFSAEGTGSDLTDTNTGTVGGLDLAAGTQDVAGDDASAEDILRAVDISAGGFTIGTDFTDTTVNLSAGRSNMTAVYRATDSSGYLVGGTEGATQVAKTTQIDVSTPATPVVTEKAVMSAARVDPSAVLFNDTIVVYGGLSGVAALATSERYEFTDNWIGGPGNLTTAKRHACVSVVGVQLLITGGDFADGIATVSENEIYDVGVGRLGADQSTTILGVGFDTASLPTDVRIEQEVVTVTAVTIGRALGSDVDVFTVTRAALGSTAAAHARGANVYEDDVTTFANLQETFAQLENALTDIVLLPDRLWANSPYLPVGSNFAWELARFCTTKTQNDDTTIGVIGVKPSFSTRQVIPTLAETEAWVAELENFSTTNYDGDKIWEIGDGVTDANDDGIPDKFAFWLTDDDLIPTGFPPAADGNILKDNKGNPFDIGAYISVITGEGVSTTNSVREKLPTIGRMNVNGAAAYAGLIASLQPQSGTTNKIIGSLAPVRVISGPQANRLVGGRYVAFLQKPRGYVVAKDVTFGHNISAAFKTDFTLLTTLRVSLAAVDIVRDTADPFLGEPSSGPQQNALQAEIEEALGRMQKAGAIQTFDFQISSTPEQQVLGQARVDLTIVPIFELLQINLSFSLARTL